MGGDRLHPGLRWAGAAGRPPGDGPWPQARLPDRSDRLRDGEPGGRAGPRLPPAGDRPGCPGGVRRAPVPRLPGPAQHHLPLRAPTSSGLRPLRRYRRAGRRRRAPHRRGPDGLAELALVALRQRAHCRGGLRHRPAQPARPGTPSRAVRLGPARPGPGVHGLLRRRVRPGPGRADLLDLDVDPPVAGGRGSARHPLRGARAPGRGPGSAPVDHLGTRSGRLLRGGGNIRGGPDGRSRVPDLLPAEPLRLLAPAHRRRLPAHDRGPGPERAAGRPPARPLPGRARHAAAGGGRGGPGLRGPGAGGARLRLRPGGGPGPGPHGDRGGPDYAGRLQRRHPGHPAAPLRPGLGRPDHHPADRGLLRRCPTGHLRHPARAGLRHHAHRGRPRPGHPGPGPGAGAA